MSKVLGVAFVAVCFCCNHAKAVSFGFERLPGTTADVLVDVSAPFGTLPPIATTVSGDVFAIDSVSTSGTHILNPGEDPEHTVSGFTQAAAEALITIPTGATGFAPNLDVSTVTQANISTDFSITQNAVASANASASASFDVTGPASAGGLFVGGIHVAAAGLATTGSASGTVQIGTKTFSISAEMGENFFLSIIWPVAVGSTVTMSASADGFVNLFVSDPSQSSAQGQLSSTVTIFGFAAEVPGDTDCDGDVDDADLLVIEDGFGISTGATIKDGDIDGDGDVDGLDLLFWQQLFAPTAPAAGSAAVPEPSTAFLSLLMVVGCIMVSRRSSFSHRQAS